MWRRSGRIALAACLLPASSCATTKCDDYRYLDFKTVPGMVILDTRVPKLSGLRDVKPFPISYVLKRERYRISVRAYEKDYGATVTLSVDSEAPLTLQVTRIPIAADGTGCIVKVEQGRSVKFSWLGKVGCAANQSLSMAVLDTVGTLVAVENLSFSVVANGRYCVKDSL